MIGRLAALILLSAVSKCILISLTEVQLGDDITFTCPVSDNEGQFFYWYKQSLGYISWYKVAAGILGVIKLSEKFQDSHLTVTKGDNQYFLNIRNVSKEDEATYFCQNGTAYSQTTINGTFLAVKGKITYMVSVLTLQCSLLSKDKENSVQCPGEHSVHWFRPGSGRFDPGVIYTHRNRSNEPEERSCVYSWSKTIQDSSDAGTYYCAVVTCGQILFGEGTTVDTSRYFQ
uniref:Ig-like domain-containing protein n=1 Tax=Mastacembelus armatus TaxID=205130 RepID=A0A3Q3N481_9TELE